MFLSKLRLFRPLLCANKAMMHTKTKTKGLFFYPRMQVHSRGYNVETGDLYIEDFLDMSQYITDSNKCEDIAYVYKKYEELTVDHIAFSFQRIGKYYFLIFIGTQNWDRGDEFYETILPRVKSQMKTLDRNCVRSLYKIIEGAAAMRLQDNEFWEIVEEKLIDNRLHRYLTIDQTCHLVCLLGLVGRGSDELIELCEKYIIKHRKALTDDNIRIAAEGFKLLDKGSAVLFEVLRDPTRGFKQIKE